MKTFDGYKKRTLTDSNLLLASGGDKPLSDFIGTLNWDSTNRKLQYKKIGDTSWNDLVTFGSNALNSISYLPLTGGTLTDTNSTYILKLKGSTEGVGMLFNRNSTNSGLIINSDDYGIALLNVTAGYLGIGIKNNGTPYFKGSDFYTLWHAGNSNLSTINWTAKDLTAYGNIYCPNIGEGFEITGDPNYFGTNADGILFTFKDGNDNYPDGGMMFRANGKAGVVNLLKIRCFNTAINSGEFLWKGYDIYHAGNLSPLTTSNYSSYCLPLSGGTMTGNILFSGDNNITWSRNTDSAKIHFKNTGDGDSDSYLGFLTSDNGNEYFKFGHTSGSTYTEWMSIKSDGLRVGGTKVSLEGHTHLYAGSTTVGGAAESSVKSGYVFTSGIFSTGGSVSSNYWCKFARLQFNNGAWSSFDYLLYFGGNENSGQCPNGLLTITGRAGGNATTLANLELYWLSLNNPWYADKIIAVQVSSNVYDLYISNLMYYLTFTVYVIVATNREKLIFETGTWSSTKPTAAYTSYLKGRAIANDVYSWAKAATKPTYTYSEVGAQPAGNYVSYGYNTADSTIAGTNNVPGFYNTNSNTLVSGYGVHWYVLNMGRYSSSNYASQIAMPFISSLSDSEMFIRTANSTTWRAWRRVLHSGNYTSYCATANHNHTYNVNDAWLRKYNDDNYFKCYGNSRSMVFRTDGTTGYSDCGGYPFVFNYGGDSSAYRKMLISTGGDIWGSGIGWVSTIKSTADGALQRSGGTMSGKITSSFRSNTWINSVNNSVITLTDDNSTYGGWICGPTRNGRIAISSYSANDDNLYIGYAERGKTANAFTRSTSWNGANGNWTTAGSFYANSDIRYKTVKNYLNISVEMFAYLPIFNYIWNNKNDDIIHIGSSAQAVELVIPELVTEDSIGFKSLDYSILGTIAGITACKELVALKSEIDLLKERIKELELQLKMINDYGRC